MVVCELDPEVSGEILGWKLPAWQALVLHRVLPSCGGLVVYLTLICFDLALIFEHFQNDAKVIAAFCIILILLPAVVSLIFTLASPPPGLQTELSGFTISIQKKDVRWIGKQFLNCLFFPVAAIGRYCYLIFWWVEVVFASRAEDEERTRDAISRARAPSPMELYLFLQAFLHSAPHTIVNILDLMVRFNNPVYGKASVQAVSIVVSCMRMASTATVYRRFEREKVNGRKYPWKENYQPLLEKSNGHIETKASVVEEEPIYESIMKPQIDYQNNSFRSSKSDDTRSKANSDLIKFSPRNTQQEENIFYDDIDTDSSSDYSPSAYNEHQPSPTYNSDDEYVRPISIIDRVAPRRSTTDYRIEKVEIAPPPVFYAPRPGSFAVWAEKLVENAEAIPTWLSAPPRRKYNDEVIKDEPDIPRRIPSNRIRGLEPQDATAALVHFLGWYAFFISRLLSIAAFINLSVFAAVMVLFSHYQIMLLLLIVPQASTVKRGFYIFLAFVYLFCLMEFKIRFRHVRVWHVFWIIVCTVETIVFTGLWAGVNNELHDWWKNYVVKVIIISKLLAFMCFLVYFVLLQPRETIVYKNNNNKVSKE